MTLKPLDIFNLLSEREKDQVRAALNIQQSPCERTGHKYKAVSTTDCLFAFLNKTTMCCSQCGKCIKV
jgi:hypothetical protein